MATKSTEKRRQSVHLVVAGASQFGQYACARVLHRVYAHATKVTLIVARKDEVLFFNKQPAISEWRNFSSLYECLEKLKSERSPINYVFDDHIQYLAAELLKEEGDYDRIGYVATQGEEHLPYTTILATCCDRVLVEKPVSKCVADIRPDGLFTMLEKQINNRWFRKKNNIKKIFTCEHFVFRKGFSDAKKELVKFIDNHWSCKKIRYEFRFFEPSRAESLVSRLSAMQDGSILDVAVTHGLGPLSFILRKKLKHNNFDLHDCITWNKVLVKQAREREHADAPLTVPVLAETAAYLEGTFEHKDAPLIHLKIESGKGGISPERYFRFVCEDCTTPEEEYFFGVSLGLAGYSKYDRKKPNKELDAYYCDGGWKSDEFGDSKIPAENAQASMLEHFINGDYSRFIPLDQACQIVRLGIEAQAIGFCQTRFPYRLDQRLDNWSNHRQNQAADSCNKNYDNLKKIWENQTALERLKMAIGVKKKELSKEDYFRVVTIFGPEGLGNTDISEKLQKTLTAELNSKDVVHLISVPRDTEWCKGRGSSAFSVERVMRDLGEKLNIATDVRKDTATDLCNRVRKCSQLLKPCILIINGIDRLGSEANAQLIRVLNELPTSIRIIMVTNKGEQTCGLVIRSEELIGKNELLPKLIGFQDRHGLELRDYLKTVSGSTLTEEEKKKDFTHKISQFANDNLTLYRQLCGYFRFIAFPKITEMKPVLPKEELKSILDRELTALSLPRTITSHPEAMLDRISSLCIGAIQPAENLRLLRSLAEVPDRIPQKFLESLKPGLSEQMEIKKDTVPMHSVIEHTPKWNDETFNGNNSMKKIQKNGDIEEGSDKNTFAIFPRVRMALCDHNGQHIQQVCADVDRRRTSLSVPFDPEKPGRFYINLSLELLFNLVVEISPGFGRFQLENVDLFKAWYKELVDSLDRGHGEHLEKKFHEFLTTLLSQKKNQDLETPYGFGKLDLGNGSLFGKRCRKLAVALERGYIGRPDSRLHKFLTILLGQKTNLGLETRAYMIAMEAWMHLRSVTEGKNIIPLMEQISEADDIALRFVPFNEALNDPFCRNSINKDVEEVKPSIAFSRYLVSASLELEGAWYWLYGIKVPPAPRCSEQLEGKVNEAEERIKKCVKNDHKYLSDEESINRKKEHLAVLMRVLSLREAYKKEKENKLEINNPFNAEITQLENAYKLLNDSFDKASGEALISETEKGICIRLGINQSILALLYFHRATKLEGDTTKKKEALDLAAAALKALKNQYDKYNFKFDECPFSLLALARIRHNGAQVDDLEPGKTPKKLTEEARNIFCLTGRDYFFELAKKMEEEFSEDKDTGQKGGS